MTVSFRKYNFGRGELYLGGILDWKFYGHKFLHWAQQFQVAEYYDSSLVNRYQFVACILQSRMAGFLESVMLLVAIVCTWYLGHCDNSANGPSSVSELCSYQAWLQSSMPLHSNSCSHSYIALRLCHVVGTVHSVLGFSFIQAKHCTCFHFVFLQQQLM